jgi:hypothetical protein
MPAIETSFAVAVNTLATEKRNSKIKPSFLMVDNVAGAADAVIIVNDVFTPSITAGVPTPGLQTIPRLHFTVPALECDSLEDELKDVEFLGLVQIVRVGGVDANCFASFAYHFE